MCGIAGVLNPAAGSREALERGATAMADSLAHRGPDDNGLWSDPEAGLAITHRRLSIVDLSLAGHQPMTSADGRFVITYNGEVYNFQELRAELEARGVTFRSTSDTEVMLEAFSAYGVTTTIKRLIGMFALGIWDRKERTLMLVRDRLGIKPLYWGKFDRLFLFGSELKSLRTYPGWQPRIDSSAVAAFMRLNYVPAPHTIYQGVRMLEPGSILTLPMNGEPRIEKYWDAREVARNGLANPLQSSDAELTDQLETLLQDAVRRRMVADVPVGAFLSGGVDSSTVAALMQTANAGPVRTYSIGFDLPGYNEAGYAAAVAKHLGTEHTEMIVSPQQALDVIPRLPEFYDEPFADSSQIPTFLVSQMTRQHVTVALSGDGGDELFAGYNRYQFASTYWPKLQLLPAPLRHLLTSVLTSLSADQWTRLLSFAFSRNAPSQAGDKIYKLAAVLKLDDEAAMYRHLVSHWNPADLMQGVAEATGTPWPLELNGGFTERMQLADIQTYLPDDILAKVDRASMAVALEARVPLLDHRVVEFSWRLPRTMKLRDGTTKWLLRQVLYRHVPRELIDRPKMGFGIPIGEWLRGPLRDWAENLLSEQRLREAGLLNVQQVRQCWQDHLGGRHNRQYELWNVLMLEAWRERWGGT
jgi:asparagine synthase (glutamine-hydrolysing)